MKQDEAIAKIKEHGGKVVTEGNSPDSPVIVARIWRTDATDGALETS